jgi:hypothetical protein
MLRPILWLDIQGKANAYISIIQATGLVSSVRHNTGSSCCLLLIYIQKAAAIATAITAKTITATKAAKVRMRDNVMDWPCFSRRFYQCDTDTQHFLKYLPMNRTCSRSKKSLR